MKRPVLGVISPLTPAWTGIADYTARLLPHLEDQWDVVVFIGDDDPDPTNLSSRTEVMHVRSWSWYCRIGSIDRLLLCLGNSKYHLHVPEMIARHGGVVLAHDVRMTALCCLLAAADADRHWLSALVAQRHGIELAREIAAIEDRSPVAESFAEVRRRLEEANTLLLAPVARGADAVLVHSCFAARLARLELAQTGVSVSVIPFGHPDITVGPCDRAPALIATFGQVGPEKHPSLLVESFASIRRRLPAASLRFVGVVDPAQRQVLEDQARRAGVADGVTFTGRIDEAAYNQELARATVAVQLRAVVNGEASAAVADCLAAGVPTVVSDVGAHTELPGGVAMRVSADVDSYDLGEEIANLLLDPPRREGLSCAGRGYAESSSFAVAAEGLTRALKAAPRPRV
jgi:glycosyltransferase involved in cell wall biosynthesis